MKKRATARELWTVAQVGNYMEEIGTPVVAHTLRNWVNRGKFGKIVARNPIRVVAEVARIAADEGITDDRTILTKEDVRVMKLRAKRETNGQLAKAFGLHPSTVTRVLNGERWGKRGK